VFHNIYFSISDFTQKSYIIIFSYLQIIMGAFQQRYKSTQEFSIFV